MLHLKHRTSATWARQALTDVPRLLADQLSCEYKAAAMARRMARHFLSQDPADVRSVVTALEELAREEEAHASVVEQLQRQHGWAAPPGKALYTAALRKAAMARGVDGAGGGGLEMLLVSGLIEARSCERFGLLAQEARGTPLGGFFEDFLAAEARHLALFVELAAERYGEAAARKRLEELAQIEARISAAMPFESRMH